MQDNTEKPIVWQIADSLKNTYPKVYTIDNHYFQIEGREQVETQLEIIKEHKTKSLPLRWKYEDTEKEGIYKFTLHSYFNDSILFGIESDYKDLQAIIFAFDIFIKKQKIMVLRNFNEVALMMPTHKNFNLSGSADRFCNWYICKYIGQLETTFHITTYENRIKLCTKIDYSFFDRLYHTPELLFEHVAEFFNEIENKFNFKPALRAEDKKPQHGGNKVTPLQKQAQLDILKNAVNELCRQNHGKPKNDRLSISDISAKALLTGKPKGEKTLGRYVKDLNLGTTAKQYIGQLVGQYCNINSLNINYFT